MKSLDLFTILHIDLANLHLNLKSILMAKRPQYSSNEGCVPSHGVVYSSAGSWELEGKGDGIWQTPEKVIEGVEGNRLVL